MSCTLRHRGTQLILAYSSTKPAVLATSKGRGGMLLFLLFRHFLSFFSFSSVPLFHFYYLFYLSSLFQWETAQNDAQGWRIVKPQHNQSSTYVKKKMYPVAYLNVVNPDPTAFSRSLIRMHAVRCLDLRELIYNQGK